MATKNLDLEDDKERVIKIEGDNLAHSNEDYLITIEFENFMNENEERRFWTVKRKDGSSVVRIEMSGGKKPLTLDGK